ncbi:FxSxx-COOH system tetratricopeptide repeat protein [Streptomyces sp. 4N509B]|uniref:FxSxx-COOH system tetratricopeptide repeat protein n=1 Tax=Streptomyces sp. 4N509B TaxID=3457413 RepID=UPI003FD043D7
MILPPATPRHGPTAVSWPHQVGVIPPRARAFQHRALVNEVREAVAGGGTAVLGQVLAGGGGVGKTQLAADYARTALRTGAVDLLVWITAASRAAVVAGYAQAGVEVLRADPRDPERAARAFLAWLEPKPTPDHTPPRWLVVLDDVADPADLRGLWPPAHPDGRTLATTRRRDAALVGEGRRLVDVGLFTPSEATAYLAGALTAHGRHEPPEELAALATALGHLPLALSQAAAYLVDAALDCATYRRLLADQTSRLADLLPDPAALPDDQSATVAAAWSLSVDRADQLRPAGLARPMLQLAAMLDANGIPAAVLTSPPALAHLAAGVPAGVLGAPDRPVTEPQAVGALRALHRLSLVDHQPDVSHQAVRVHQLIQRTVRDAMPRAAHDALARTAADALMAAWPAIDRDTDLARALRANAMALAHHAEDALWRPGTHSVLFRIGTRLGESGQVTAAVAHFRRLADTAHGRLGPDHTTTLSARHNLAYYRGEAGEPGAADAFAELLVDRVRVLGPDHPDTLTTRHELAYRRGRAGDAVGAVAALAEVLADKERILGADHPDTLTVRHNLAHYRGVAGDVTRAVDAFAELLATREYLHGPDHPETLKARSSLIRWRAQSGDVDGALAALTHLLADRERVLGADHPHTLTTRHNLAHWRGRAGDAAGAAAAFAALLPDRVRVQGPDHPDTLVTRHEAARWRGHAGDAPGAAAELVTVLADHERVLGPDHPSTQRTRTSLDYWQAAAQPKDTA